MITLKILRSLDRIVVRIDELKFGSHLCFISLDCSAFGLLQS